MRWARSRAHADALTPHLTSLSPSEPEIDRAAIDEVDQSSSEFGSQVLAGTVKRSLPQLRGWAAPPWPRSRTSPYRHPRHHQPVGRPVALIKSTLTAALGSSTLTADTITIGTAHAFQGGECDVVLFSPALATGAPLATAMWVEKQRNLINVAVSRTKRAFIIFGDHAALAELPVPTLHALATAARTAESAPTRAPAPTDTDVAENADLHSHAERRLYAALLRLDLTVHW